MPRKPSSAGRRAALAVVLIALCAGTLLGLQRAGAAARGAGAAAELARDRVVIDVVATADDLWRLWNARGLHGRVVVHLGSFLHFEPPEPAVRPSAGTFTPPAVTHRSYLWLASQEHLARRIVNVLPGDEFRDRFGIRWGSPLEDVSDAASPERTISARLPRMREPVVLAVDASWFTVGDPAALARALLASGLRADVFTASFALDNPDVADAARLKLADFLEIMSGTSEIRRAFEEKGARP